MGEAPEPSPRREEPPRETLETARQRAWEYYIQDNEFGLRLLTSGMPIQLSGKDLRKLYVLEKDVDAEGLADLVNAKTARVTAELRDLGKTMQLALDGAVQRQLKEPPAVASREPVRSGDGDLHISVEVDGWHIRYDLRIEQDPELQEWVDRGGKLGAKWLEEVDLILEQELGTVRPR